MKPLFNVCANVWHVSGAQVCAEACDVSNGKHKDLN